MVMGADGKELKFTDLEIATEEEVAEMLRRKPMPNRTMVAISEDRQWLVVLPPKPDHGPAYWRFVRWVSDEDGYWEHDEYWRDNGQDAHDVLAAWLKEREA